MTDQILAKIVTPVTAVNQAHRELRQAIVQGRLAPGARLIETQLADMLGVSRTPIREALSRLEAEGLVHRVRGGGLVVGDVVADGAVILGIRQRLEGFAARLAAERMGARELDALQAACDAGGAAVERMSLVERREINFRFHLLLAKGSHSALLVKLIEEYYDYSVTEQTLPLYDTELVRQHQSQHREIVAALRAGDGARAEQVVFEHLQNVQETQSDIKRSSARPGPAESESER